MKVFEANVSIKVLEFFSTTLGRVNSITELNEIIYRTSGIINFLSDDIEYGELKERVLLSENLVEEPDRTEYGDFQTNSQLAFKVAEYLACQSLSPELVIEPTCGKGNFILAVLHYFSTVKTIIGVEIYKPYTWESKFSIIDFFLSNPNSNRPDIHIYHCNVFDFDFRESAKGYLNSEILIIGNPPWVTNSKLGSLNSNNLPRKSNFKNHTGIEAITGKGNFDIAEFIASSLIDTFQRFKGSLVFLVKNSVVKNIVFDQQKRKYSISAMQKHVIDSKKEFNVSVESCLFYCRFNASPEFHCVEYDFYSNQEPLLKFGWFENKFVSRIDTYKQVGQFDGASPLIWRQGLKHDCSSVMELERKNDTFSNGLQEEVSIEEDLVYPLLKSSDLKGSVLSRTRKFTIVTQKTIAQDTKYIKSQYPYTFSYLSAHSDYFNSRKSSIYVNKPQFSIFGIGDYSFKPFKVAISGLYKTMHFSLVLPVNGKPVMLDDTCYFLGFDRLEFAVFTQILLNSESVQELLKSITFQDAKRTFTKDVLMRIDLLKVAEVISMDYLNGQLNDLNQNFHLILDSKLWFDFLRELTPVSNGQLVMFT